MSKDTRNNQNINDLFNVLDSHIKNEKNKYDRKLKTLSSQEKIWQSGAETGGIILGNVGNASTILANGKFTIPSGHGFAAEQANHLMDAIVRGDLFTQNRTKLVGEDLDPSTGRIIKNGADRMVDGVFIQSKYYSSGNNCIAACFEDGQFRYYTSDGSPMQIEVPSDMYESAIEAMEHRIKDGQVSGVTDPKEARNIVRKGHLSYVQARNIARFGTIESIAFDVVNGAIVGAVSGSLSAIAAFAISYWNNESTDIAIQNAAKIGLKVGGITLITAVISSQLSKAGLNSVLVGGSEALASAMGPNVSAIVANAFRSGTNIYGAAAMKSTAKILRGNAVTGIVSVAVLSSADVFEIFRGRISGMQLVKNVTTTITTVAAGMAGRTAGAAVGSVIPGPGTFIGGLVGSAIGGVIGNEASSFILDNFIEDDAKKMLRIIEEVFYQLTTDYLLNKNEAEVVADQLKEVLTAGLLKDMFNSLDQYQFAMDLLLYWVEGVVKQRKRVSLPSANELNQAMYDMLVDSGVV